MNKLTTIKLNAKTLQPITESETIVAYAGSEPGHFFVPFLDTNDAVFTSRSLADGATVVPEAVSTRIRVIVKNESASLKDKLDLLGFSRKSDNSGVHYSRVVDNGAAFASVMTNIFSI